MSKLPLITATEFPAAIAGGPTLVDFGAPWCAPCKALEPVLVEISEDLSGKLAIVKVDIDAEPDLAANLGVMTVPTLMLFKEGKRLGVCTGNQTRAQILAMVGEAF